MGKAISWIVAAIGVACTIMFVITGLGGDTEMDWLNGWIVGPILLLFVVPELFFFGRMFSGFGQMLSGEVPKTFHNAPIGMGTVVSVSRTGLSINDQPQLDILLDIDTPDGQSFRGVARQIIDQTELAAVTPGVMLPVRYLPGSTDGRVALATDAPQHELQAALNRVQLAKGLMTPRQLQIAEQGIEARAVVLAMTPTGEIRGDRSVLSITMRVTRPDGSTFDIQQEKPVQSDVIGQVQPGMVVRAMYLPHDESEVAIATALAA